MLRHVTLALALLALPASVVHAQGVREVTYGTKSVVAVATKVRFTTLIVLPDDEEILDFVCGDKDQWVISGAQNFAYVKPAKSGASTNLNLVTAKGHVYSFLLAEGNADPDLKLYVRSETPPTPSGSDRRFFSGKEMEALRTELTDARAQLDHAREATARAVEDAANAKLASESAAEHKLTAFRASYPKLLKFPYRFRANERPFLVSAIFHDDRFTYIRCNATELPALYELVDGQPNLLTFQVEDGLYIVPKVLDRGYLALGKQVLRFDQNR